MQIINTWTDELIPMTALADSLGNEYGFLYQFYCFLMDTINGRNDVRIDGITPDELNRLLLRLQKRM